MATLTKKQSFLRMRIKEEQKDIIKYAAECKGQDMTSYILGHILEHAAQDIKQYKEIEKLVLSKNDSIKIEEELKDPSLPNEKLVNAFKQYPDDVEEDDD